MKNKKGFTLIELLAVIAILGILIVIAGLSVTSILKKSKTDVIDVQGNKLIDIAKLIVMENPDVFSCKYLDISGYPAPTGIECKLGTGNSCDCVINDNGFNGYADTKVNGCVFVSGCTNDSCGKETTYKYEYDAGKCPLKMLSEKIIEDNGSIKESKPDFRKTATTDEGLIKDVDDDGSTYYFRGAVEDNYVKFDGLKWANTDGSYHKAGEDMLWRIVRINGDGTIRLIADGSIGTSEFNTSYSNEKYVGYTYDNSKANVQDGTDSKIKTYLEDWYEENMMPYDEYIATSKFCNDTTVTSTSGSSVYYGARNRLFASKDPSFKCNKTDKTYGGLYTDLKVGLITADEVAFAGGQYSGTNSSYYLAGRTSSYFWTASPDYFNSYTSIWYVNSTGDMDDLYINYAKAVLPVINLKASVQLTNGSGTKSDPYVVG